MLATLNSVNKGIRLTQNACEYVFISFIPKLPSPPLPPKKTEGFLFFFATAGRSSRATLVQFPTLFSSSPYVSLEISSPSLPPLRLSPPSESLQNKTGFRSPAFSSPPRAHGLAWRAGTGALLGTWLENVGEARGPLADVGQKWNDCRKECILGNRLSTETAIHFFQTVIGFVRSVGRLDAHLISAE